MRRLIDADEAYKVLTDYYHHKTEIQHKALKEAIERVPIVDAEPVVRCRDCKFYLYSEEMCGLLNTRLHFYETDNVWTRDCFCSWGERGEDETD